MPLALARGRQRLAMERAVRVAESAGALLAAPARHGPICSPLRARRRFPQRGIPPPAAAPRCAGARDRGGGPLSCSTTASPSAPGPARRVRVAGELRRPARGAEGGARAGAAGRDRRRTRRRRGGWRSLSTTATATTWSTRRLRWPPRASRPRCSSRPGTSPRAKGFWWDELEHILLHRAERGRAGPGARARRAAARVPRRQRARAAVSRASTCTRWLQPLAPEEIDALCWRAPRLGGRGRARGPAPEPDRAMTPDGLRTFAGHAGSERRRPHPLASLASPRRRGHAGCRDRRQPRRPRRLARKSSPPSFSYPFGVPGADVDDAVVARVRAAGFSLGVTTSPGALPADRFMLPRRVVPDLDAEAFEEWLHGRPSGDLAQRSLSS